MSKSNVIIKIVNDDYTNDSSIPNMINYIYRTKTVKVSKPKLFLFMPMEYLLFRQPTQA